MKLFIHSIVILLLSIAIDAVAEIYVGGGLGVSRYRSYGQDFDNATSYEMKGGYRFSNQLSLEAGYTNLGDSKGATFDQDVVGYNVSVLSSMPITPGVSTYGRIGYYLYQGTLTGDSLPPPPEGFSNNLVTLTQNSKYSFNDVGLSYGLGVIWDAAPRTAIYVEYLYFDVDQKVKNISIGFTYSI